jgi:trk system potassium uptake protein TrkA
LDTARNTGEDHHSGAGQVGSSVAENLVSESNDITVVDTDVERLHALQDRLDLRVVVGNGASPLVMRRRVRKTPTC